MEAKVIVITGASRGIGLAVAKWLLSFSGTVNVVAAGRSKEALEALKEMHDGRLQTAYGDLEDDTEGRRLVEYTVKTFKRIDGIVLNHGTLHPGKTIADCTVEEWRSAFTVNFFSMVVILNEAIPHLRRTCGSVVFTSSGAARSAHQAWGPYGASKSAVNHLVMTLGTEEPLISCIAVEPGVVDTEMQRQLREVYASALDEKDVEFFKMLHEKGRLIEPAEPARIIGLLVLRCPEILRGQCVKWDDEELKNVLELAVL